MWCECKRSISRKNEVVMMLNCPYCGKPWKMTSAIRGRLKHGTMNFKCRGCDKWYEIEPGDAPAQIVTRKNEAVDIRVRKRLDDSIIAERRYYGLCLKCGKPTKNSEEYCEGCK